MLDRVIFIVTHSSDGGAQEILLDISRGLEREGFTCDNFAMYPGDVSGKSTNWDYIYSTRPRDMLSWLKLSINLFRKISKNRNSVFITALPLSNFMVTLLSTITMIRRNIIITHHSPINSYSTVLRLLNKLAGMSWSARNVVCVSSSVRETIGFFGKFYFRKIVVVNNAIPNATRLVLERIQQRDYIGTKRNKAVAIGRLSKEKNYSQIIEAISKIPEMELHIAGEGPERFTLERLTEKLGVGDRVRFYGHLPRDRALSLLSSADVFIQTSLFEGHSLALLEAASLSIPIVVSDVPAQREAVTLASGDLGGIVIALHDAQALSNELRRLSVDDSYYTHWTRMSKALATRSSYNSMIESYASLLIVPR